MFFHAGVTITNDPLPFMVGQDAVLTCSSDTGVIDRIQWVSRDGMVLASDTSVQQLQFMLRPVNDSLSIHTSNFTCYVTKDEGGLNQTISNKTLPVTVLRTVSSLTFLHACVHTHSHIHRKHRVTCIYNPRINHTHIHLRYSLTSIQP